MHRLTTRMCASVVVVAGAMVAGTCGKSTTPTPASVSVASIVASASTVGGISIQASQQSGSPPGASGGAVATITSPPTAVSSGGNVVGVSGSVPFQQILISVGGATATTGFLQINLPAPTTTQQLLISYANSLPSIGFTEQFQLVSGGGAVGLPASVPTTVVPLASASPSVVVTFSANPAPFIGVPCANSGTVDCLYNFTVTLREVNGVGLAITSRSDMGSISGGPPFTNKVAFAVTIPPLGTTTHLGGFICPAATPSCGQTPPTVAGFEQITYVGTDANGHPFTLTSPKVTLAPGG